MVTVVTENAVEELNSSIAQLEGYLGRKLNKEEERSFQVLLAKVSVLKRSISPAEFRQYERERMLQAAGLPRDAQAPRAKLPATAEREWRDFGADRPIRRTAVPPDREIRANEAGQQSLTATQGPAGGYFVPQGISDRAYESMKQHDEVFDPMFSNIVETVTGDNMPFPSMDDVANASVQVGETVQSSEVDVANFGNVQLGAFSFRSKVIGLSFELLQDSNFPWPAILERCLSMRHARGVGQALVTGAGGGSSPTGLLTAVVASGASPVIAAGSAGNDGGAETGAASLGTADFNACFQKLDRAYRRQAVWAMNDATLESAQGVLDKQGHPLVNFRRGLSDVYADRPTILGRPVGIMPSMPTMASGHNTVVLYDPNYFVQRRVTSMYVRKFTQNATLVQFGLIGFESWLRVDSNLVAPNSSYLPAQFIQQHS
jgi:HK97 family phage major capsid protein